MNNDEADNEPHGASKHERSDLIPAKSHEKVQDDNQVIENLTEDMTENEPRRGSWIPFVNSQTSWPRVGSIVSLVYPADNANHVEPVGEGQSGGPMAAPMMNYSFSNSEITPEEQMQPILGVNASSVECETPQETRFASLYSWLQSRWKSDQEQSDSIKQSELPEETLRDVQKSLTNNSTSVWAIYESGSDHYLCIAGEKSESHPIKVDFPLPLTQQERQEASLRDSQLAADFEELLVVPQPRTNLRRITKRTYLRLLLSRKTSLFQPEQHLYLRSPSYRVRKPVSIRKRALVLGVHTFLPIKFVRTLIGQPTGSAKEFCANIKTSLLNWAWAQDPPVHLDIETIDLEGEGTIQERVAQTLKLLENWSSSLASADYLFIASHLQTVPVAIHLAAELLKRKKLDRTEKIGLLNMGGVCMGPMSGLESKVAIRAFSKSENEVIDEIFQLQDSKSEPSISLERSLQYVCNSGKVVTTFAGLAKDTFVPFYSSMYVGAEHPSVYRLAAVEDGFLGSLIRIILTLKNLSYSDHELILEISKFLPAQNNCSIFSNKSVYENAVENTLGTSHLVNHHDCEFSSVNAKTFRPNPYHLPWCLRGVIQEAIRLKHLDGREVVSELFELFKLWDPSSKAHKELKYCIDIIGKQEIGDLNV